MFDLYTYITNTNCIHIHSIEEAELWANKAAFGGEYIFDFDMSSYKEYFLNVLKIINGKVDIINCDSQLDRFMDDINESDGLIVFNNARYCKDLDQFNYVIKNKIVLC